MTINEIIIKITTLHPAVEELVQDALTDCDTKEEASTQLQHWRDELGKAIDWVDQLTEF